MDTIKSKYHETLAATVIKTLENGGGWPMETQKVPQSLEIGLFFCQIFIFII